VVVCLSWCWHINSSTALINFVSVGETSTDGGRMKTHARIFSCKQITEPQAGCVKCDYKQWFLNTSTLLERVPNISHKNRWLQVQCESTPIYSSQIRGIKIEDIIKFRDAPVYELIFFTFKGGSPSINNFFEKLQYCRMLLKPGGMIVLIVPNDQAISWFTFVVSLMYKSYSSVVIILKRAGFIKVKKRINGRNGVLVYGERPGSRKKR
jgi:hypothetical protein